MHVKFIKEKKNKVNLIFFSFFSFELLQGLSKERITP